jgi:hypothetical protein
MNADTPRTSGPGAQILSFLSLCVALFVLGGLFLATTLLRARFLGIFRDFDAELPPLTQWVILATNPAFAAGLVAVGLALVLKEVLVPDVRVKIAVNLAAVTAAAGLGALFYVALCLPLWMVIQRLS